MTLKFLINFNFLLQGIRLPLLVSGDHLSGSLHLRPSIFGMLIVHGAKFRFRIEFQSYHTLIFLGRSVLTVRSIFFGKLTGFFNKLVTNIRIGTCVCTSSKPRACSTVLVRLAVWFRSLIMRPLSDVTTITDDSVSSGLVICFRLEPLHALVSVC